MFESLLNTPDPVSLWLAIIGGVIVGLAAATTHEHYGVRHVTLMLAMVWLGYFGLLHIDRFISNSPSFDAHFVPNLWRYGTFLLSSASATAFVCFFRHGKHKEFFGKRH